MEHVAARETTHSVTWHEVVCAETARVLVAVVDDGCRIRHKLEGSFRSSLFPGLIEPHSLRTVCDLGLGWALLFRKASSLTIIISHERLMTGRANSGSGR